MTFVAFLYPICPLLYPVHIESDMQCSECCSQLYSLSTMWFFFVLVIVYLYYMPPLPSFFVSIGCANARHRAPRSWMARLQHNFLNTVMNHSCIAQAESNNGFQRAAALFSCYTCRTLFACRYSPETFLRPSVSCLQGTWANMLGTQTILVTTSRPPLNYITTVSYKKNYTNTFMCTFTVSRFPQK